MKHKNLSFIGKSLMLTVLATITINVSNLFSQANQGINVNNGNQPFWKLGGNNNTDENSFIGTINEQDFVIKTNNEERFRVTTDNYTIFNDSVRIKGPLYIGDSSMVFEDNVGPLPFTDRISSNKYAINFMRRIYSPIPIPGITVYQSNIRLGVGIQEPVHQMHLHHAPALGYPIIEPTVVGFTNNITSASATDGFLVGINSDGVAELRQQENLPIRIFTNEGLLHEQRMIISHDVGSNFPRVGIGTSVLSEPRTFLHIGQDINVGGNGYRNWMNIGELVVNNQEDNMYFGFSDSISIPGTSDYIINWGTRSSDENNNILRFVNTTGNTAVTSGSTQGLEVARMVSNGTLGSMGININP